MESPVQELKTRAELLHAAVASGQPDALRRLRALPGLAKADDAALTAAAASVQRKHCLAVVAREHGFSRWDQARRVLAGDSARARRRHAALRRRVARRPQRVVRDAR